MRALFLSLLFALPLLGTTRAFAQFTPPAQGQAQSSATTSLLDGRLSMVLPPNAKIENPPGLAPNAAALRDETHIGLDHGAVHFTMIAEELYAKIGANAADDVARYAKDEKPEPFTIPSGLKCWAFAPTHGEPPQPEQNIVYVAIIVHPDGGVIQLGFFVNQAGLANKAGWVGFAQQMIRHVTAGPRKLDLAAADRSFHGVQQNDKLALTTPAGWVTSTEDGPDFFVFRARKVGELGHTPSECGIYLGQHPNLLHMRNPQLAQLKPGKGKLLGKGADWFQWSDATDAWLSEAIVTHPIDPKMSVHAFCTAESEAGLKDVRVVMDSLRISH